VTAATVAVPAKTVAAPAATVAAPVRSTPVVQVQVIGQPPAVQSPTPVPPLVAPATPRGVEDELKQYQILLETPSLPVLFGHLDSEKDLEKRMRQQAMERTPPSTVEFPDREPISKATFKDRAFPAHGIYAEPNFICHDRLFFEEKNSERYGWDLGFIQPFVSMGYFVRDAAAMPLVFMGQPLQRFDTSAGKCMPGDPVPYIYYPPELTGIAKAASLGLIAALP